MTSVDFNFNFLCGRPHGVGPLPLSTCVHLSLSHLLPPCGRHKWMALTSGEDSGYGRQPRQKISAPPLKPQHRVSEPVSSLETHLNSEKVKGRPNGWRYVGRKEETRLKSNGR